MDRGTSPSETILRDNVRLFVDFRDGPASQIYDYIVQLSDLVRTVAAFTYLMTDARDQREVRKIIHDLQIEDYVYLDLDADHQLASSESIWSSQPRSVFSFMTISSRSSLGG
jgi:hypothetical protein